MIRHVLWAPIARAEFAEQLTYLAKDSPDAARNVKRRVVEAVEALARMPIGRPGRVFGTYEKFVPKTSLVIAYELPDQTHLAVLRVVHAARNWPEGQWPGGDESQNP